MKEKEEILEKGQIYEIGYHLVPTIDEVEIPAKASKIKSLIEENEGLILSEETPKMAVLAYDICKTVNSKKQKFNKAYFGWVKFEIDPSQIANIKNKIEAMAEVLRFVIVKTIRENTMHTPKIPMFRKENVKEERTEEKTEKPKISEAEIDKSIDELLVS